MVKQDNFAGTFATEKKFGLLDGVDDGDNSGGGLVVILEIFAIQGRFSLKWTHLTYQYFNKVRQCQSFDLVH